MTGRRGSMGGVVLLAVGLSLLVIGGCTRDNPDFIDEGDAEPEMQVAPPDEAPMDGRTPVDVGPDGPPQTVDAGALDMGADMPWAPDPGPDMAPDTTPDMGPTDDDEDGVETPADCDDGDPDIRPGAPERCNGADDDCDEATDEGIVGLGDRCTAGAGACAADGVRVCGAGGALVCDAAVGAPGDELCNDVDDDCDGAVDEAVVGCCEPGAVRPCGSAVGACVPGEQACGDDGRFGPCTGAVEPVDERCDGLDRDCDGRVDEGFALGAGCAVGIGACLAEGVNVCLDGDVTCDAMPGMPSDDMCNGIDDDCDGAADEDFDGLGAPCSVGVGACAAMGVGICGGDGVICDARPGMPSGEACNGIDDDCDGITDESVGGGMPCEVGVGACLREGMVVCNAAGALACDVAPGPRAAERCNGVDDDCDGAVDEPFPELGDPCVVEAGGCASEGTVVCGFDGGDVTCEAPPIEGVDELCNGVDDDCDGPVDEGFGVGDACVAGLGACGRQGATVCLDDRSTTCDAMPGMPSDEICNAIDDDCDGMPDEGFGLGQACRVGVGACAADGVTACGGDGQPRCVGEPLEPGEEDCDGIDDDCDGSTDEGVANACGACGPVPDELCNAEDDDCDGQVDEGTGPCVVALGAVAAPEGAMGFGAALAVAGDLDGDGVDDALVGAPDAEAGVAAAVDGTGLAVLWSVTDIATFGLEVAAGDVDGDGVRELFVGAPGIDNGVAVQLDPAGGEIGRLPGTNDLRVGRQMVVPDGAGWLATSDRDAMPTVFGPSGGVRIFTFDGAEPTTLAGQAGSAIGARLHPAPDAGEDGLPDLLTTGEDLFDRSVVRFVDPPADGRGAPLTAGFTNGSFGESVAFGRLLVDEPPIAVYGAPLGGANQSGGIYLFDADGAQLGGLLGNGGRRSRQGHRLAVLPRPDADRDALVLSAEASNELRVWTLIRGVDEAPVIATSAAIRPQGAGNSLGRSMAIGGVGPDGTRRLFVGEPDAGGGGRVWVFSAR